MCHNIPHNWLIGVDMGNHGVTIQVHQVEHQDLLDVVKEGRKLAAGFGDTFDILLTA